MTSIAQRRRRKKARITLPGGQQIDQKPTGRERVDVGQRKQAEDPRQSALKTRLRISGIPDTPEARKAAVAPDFGHDVGLCVRAILKGDDAAKAWDTFAALSASFRAYQLHYIGQTGNPQCAAIAMIPEPMETDPSLRVDLRTHDEKVRAAKASWQAWEKRIAALPFPQMRWAISGTLRGFLGDGTLWRDAKPTDTGRAVVAALKAMVIHT
jgi:hypothetical protein